MTSQTTKANNLSAASEYFGKLAVKENNPAAAALAIHLWVESVDAYQAELAARRADTITPGGDTCGK